MTVEMTPSYPSASGVSMPPDNAIVSIRTYLCFSNEKKIVVSHQNVTVIKIKIINKTRAKL